MTDHLRPTAPIAADALLPGDPGRALALATELLEAPKMANHARGLWGYSGRTADGHELTIQSTGVGGPSVAIVLEELASLGVKRAVRLGTARALGPGLAAGEIVAVTAAIGADGTSSALGANPAPDAALTAALVAGGLTGITVASSDLHYDPDAEARREGWTASGARAADLGTAAALAAGTRLGVAVAAGLVVSGPAAGPALSDEEVEAASLRLGVAALGALTG